jgi:MOSC domain-containing protein YiiM
MRRSVKPGNGSLHSAATHPAQIVTASLVQVLATPEIGHFRTVPVEALTVDLQGIPGDRHYGFARRAGARERWYPAGMAMRSGRQLTAVAVEELAEIARRMELPRIEPGWIGANLLVSGIPDFTRLPWGTRLFFGDGAVLVNEGDNAPCRFAGAEIARNFPGRARLDILFPKAAIHLRGILASVERAGTIAPGPVKVKIPEQNIWTGGSLL